MSKTIRVGLTGDIVPMGDKLAVGPEPSDGPAGVRQCMRDCDVMVGSLLTVLSDEGTQSAKLINVRAPATRAEDLAEIGFDVVHLANNHSMDFGGEGLEGTIEALNARGIDVVGAGATLADASEALFLERDGRTVALLAWSTTLPAGSEAGPDRPGVNPLPIDVGYEFDPRFLSEEPVWPPTVRSTVAEAVTEAAAARIRDAATKADVVVACVHWGSGFGAEPATMAQPFAHALIDAGADVVLGTHPHLLHGVEVYAGRPVLYSPGMFLDQTPREGADEVAQAMFDMISPYSFVAMLDLDDAGPQALRLQPTRVGPDGVPRAAGEADCRTVLEQLTRLSRRYGTELRLVDGIIEVQLAPATAAGSGTAPGA